MKCRWQPLLALCLLSCIAFAGQEKPTHEGVADAGGLLKIHTFCLDSSELTPHQSADLQKFAAQAAKPKGLFTKLHWQRVDSCSSADATVKLTMNEHERMAPAGDGSRLEDKSAALTVETFSQARMLITDRASGKTLYQTDGKEYTDDRQAAFANTFAKLLKDLKTLSK